MDGTVAEALASLYAQCGEPVESIYAAKLATALGGHGALAALVPAGFRARPLRASPTPHDRATAAPRPGAARPRRRPDRGRAGSCAPGDRGADGADPTPRPTPWLSASSGPPRSGERRRTGRGAVADEKRVAPAALASPCRARPSPRPGDLRRRAAAAAWRVPRRWGAGPDARRSPRLGGSPTGRGRQRRPVHAVPPHLLAHALAHHGRPPRRGDAGKLRRRPSSLPPRPGRRDVRAMQERGARASPFPRVRSGYGDRRSQVRA